MRRGRPPFESTRISLTSHKRDLLLNYFTPRALEASTGLYAPRVARNNKLSDSNESECLCPTTAKLARQLRNSNLTQPPNYHLWSQHNADTPLPSEHAKACASNDFAWSREYAYATQDLTRLPRPGCAIPRFHETLTCSRTRPNWCFRISICINRLAPKNSMEEISTY